MRNFYRYRKKELLKRKANQILQKWQLEPWKHHLKSTQEIHHLIETAIKLPSGWSNEDYKNAEIRLYHVYSEIISPVNQLYSDVRDNRGMHTPPETPSDIPKLNADLKKAFENTNTLAAHIISALKLSSCNIADQAAALMEAMRFVGRNLTDTREIPCSQATTICFAAIAPLYARPIWFTKKFAEAISQQIHPTLSHEIGMYLINNEAEN